MHGAGKGGPGTLPAPGGYNDEEGGSRPQGTLLRNRPTVKVTDVILGHNFCKKS